MSKTNNNFFYFGNGKQTGEGCLFGLLLLLVFLCSPGVWAAIFVNQIVHINVGGALFVIIAVSIICFLLMASIGGSDGGKNAKSTTISYFLLCFVFGLPLLPGGILNDFFDELNGVKPSTSLISSPNGQLVFWTCFVILTLGSILYYAWQKSKTQEKQQREEKGKEDLKKPIQPDGFTTRCTVTEFGLSKEEESEILSKVGDGKFDVPTYNSFERKGHKAFYMQQCAFKKFGKEDDCFSNLIFEWRKIGEYKSELVYHEIKGIKGYTNVHLKIKKYPHYYNNHAWHWIDPDYDKFHGDRDLYVTFTMLDFCQLKLSFPYEVFELTPYHDCGDVVLVDGQAYLSIDYSPEKVEMISNFWKKNTDESLRRAQELITSWQTE